jgi:hypothetical protein
MMQISKMQEIAEAMEFTTVMNRGEVDPSLEGIMHDLSYDFSKPLLQKYRPFIEKYYRYMCLKEYQECLNDWNHPGYGEEGE